MRDEAMSCPYLFDCKNKVTKDDFERYCRCNYWECETYQELAEREKTRKTPKEWAEEEWAKERKPQV